MDKPENELITKNHFGPRSGSPRPILGAAMHDIGHTKAWLLAGALWLFFVPDLVCALTPAPWAHPSLQAHSALAVAIQPPAPGRAGAEFPGEHICSWGHLLRAPLLRLAPRGARAPPQSGAAAAAYGVANLASEGPT